MEDFVPFKIAKKLEEKGFKTENTDWCYLDGNLVQVRKYINISPYKYAPTISQVLKWLREEKEIYVSITPQYNEFVRVKGVEYRLEVHHWKDDKFGYEMIEWLDEDEPHIVQCFEFYEQAALDGVSYCLDNLI